MPSFLLMVASNPKAGGDDAYNEWYTNQHIPDVLKVPGFVAARRYQTIDHDKTSQNYLALYEIEAASFEDARASLTKHAKEMYIAREFDRDSLLVVGYEAITERIVRTSG
ncbi:DUF4286 family protein [Paraburkholderia ferrariae]|uniref:DUF4286 family protein n=1 Tax=Paraburkholderia ferrariae TaxID=386056 RepID=UPI0012EB13FB|nr:DUF4286 family protein [Paraburkholderia ferrariae]